jgi:hypothetical protein
MSTVVVCTKAPEYPENNQQPLLIPFSSVKTTCAYLCCFSADKLCSADRELEHMVHLAVGSNTTPTNSLLVLHKP